MELRQAVVRRIQLAKLQVANPAAPRFECPICVYSGPFLPVHAPTGRRPHAMCARCGSVERHRVQWLALNATRNSRDFSGMRALHCAPEAFFRPLFAPIFQSYTTADLNGHGVDHRIDLTRPLPFPPGSFDLVYASHVLEHIQEDETAIENIRRVLAPGGMAILPVPIVSNSTVEYGAPNAVEYGHVRAPGVDYYKRYEKYFHEVRIFSSADFNEKFQPFIFEDRSRWPTPEIPLRGAMPGPRHIDAVPVCYC